MIERYIQNNLNLLNKVGIEIVRFDFREGSMIINPDLKVSTDHFRNKTRPHFFILPIMGEKDMSTFRYNSQMARSEGYNLIFFDPIYSSLNLNQQSVVLRGGKTNLSHRDFRLLVHGGSDLPSGFPKENPFYRFSYDKDRKFYVHQRDYFRLR